MKNGETLADEMAVANAHCHGKRPFARADYVKKFVTLTEELVDSSEHTRFIGLCERLPQLSAAEVGQLNVQLTPEQLTHAQRDAEGIF